MSYQDEIEESMRETKKEVTDRILKNAGLTFDDKVKAGKLLTKDDLIPTYEEMYPEPTEFTEPRPGSILIPPEFKHYFQILEMGANKHGPNNWLDANGSKSSFKQMHDSMFHHLAESFSMGFKPECCRMDPESQLDPLLHLICRAQMMYTRLKRGIKHNED